MYCISDAHATFCKNYFQRTIFKNIDKILRATWCLLTWNRKYIFYFVPMDRKKFTEPQVAYYCYISKNKLKKSSINLIDSISRRDHGRDNKNQNRYLYVHCELIRYLDAISRLEIFWPINRYDISRQILNSFLQSEFPQKEQKYIPYIHMSIKNDFF